MGTHPACRNGARRRAQALGRARGSAPAPHPASLLCRPRQDALTAAAPPVRARVGSSSTWNALASFRKMGSFKTEVLGPPGDSGTGRGGIWRKEGTLDRDLGKSCPQQRRGGGGPCGQAALGPASPSDGSDPEEPDRRPYAVPSAPGASVVPTAQAGPALSTRSAPWAGAVRGAGAASTRAPKRNGVCRRSKSTDQPDLPRKSSFRRKSASHPGRAAGLARGPGAPQTLERLVRADSDGRAGGPTRPRRWRSPLRVPGPGSRARLAGVARPAGLGNPGAQGPGRDRFSRLHDDAPPRGRPRGVRTGRAELPQTLAQVQADRPGQRPRRWSLQLSPVQPTGPEMSDRDSDEPGPGDRFPSELRSILSGL